MVRWLKLLALHGLSATALLASAALTQYRSATGLGMKTHVARHPAGNSSLQCSQLEATLNRTIELFSRQLTREEYYSRNFMWIRCRSMSTKWFDMGGAWFGRDGEDLRARFEARKFSTWNFNYVKGNWGDATLFFASIAEMPMDEVFAKIRHLADIASVRYRRNLCIIDCQGEEHDPYYATERKGVPFPNPEQIQPPNGNRAFYNSRKMSKAVGKSGWWEWPKKHPMLESKEEVEAKKANPT